MGRYQSAVPAHLVGDGQAVRGAIADIVRNQRHIAQDGGQYFRCVQTGTAAKGFFAIIGGHFYGSPPHAAFRIRDESGCGNLPSFGIHGAVGEGYAVNIPFDDLEEPESKGQVLFLYVQSKFLDNRIDLLFQGKNLLPLDGYQPALSGNLEAKQDQCCEQEGFDTQHKYPNSLQVMKKNQDRQAPFAHLAIFD